MPRRTRFLQARASSRVQPQSMGSIDLRAAPRGIPEVVPQSIHRPVDPMNRPCAFSEPPLDSLDTMNPSATVEWIIQQALPPDVLTQVTCLSDVFPVMREQLTPA